MNTFEKESLGLFPTPMYRLPNLSRELGTNVWIKRDDLCGVALGGNKVRKLEYLLKEARDQGYDLVMTTGQAQSNHAMLTAACALRMGLDCILVLKKRGVTARKGNLILNHLMGVEVRYMDTDSYDDIYEEMDRIGEELGRKVYKIPCGGSNALGSLGYIDCMKEVADSGVHFDHLVCACGSGGTAAGCVLGAKIHLPETKVMCSMVDNDPFDVIVPRLMREAADLLDVQVDIPPPRSGGHVGSRLLHPLRGGQRGHQHDDEAGGHRSGHLLHRQGLRRSGAPRPGGLLQARGQRALRPHRRRRRPLCPGLGKGRIIPENHRTPPPCTCSLNMVS